jgi:deazaflavin-dependent oxidoreductase (nitroreductase family)
VPSDRSFRIYNSIHRAVFDLTRGRLAGKLAGMPVLKLTTTGRKTGKRRDTMLTSPLQDGDRVIVVASKGGDPRHPAWYLNLRDNPEVTVTMQGRTRAMTAHTAALEEKAELWPRIVASSKGYGDYQKRTDRDIPVVVLRPFN